MSDLFASPKQTLAWAKRHLNSFNAILAQIATDNDRRYVIEKNPDGVTEASLKPTCQFEFGDIALRRRCCFSASGFCKPPGQLPFKIPFSTFSDRCG